MTVDVKPTIEVIMQAAERLRQSALELERIAKKMGEGRDLGYAAEALSVITAAPGLCRVDLLVVRPLRAYEADRGAASVAKAEEVQNTAVQGVSVPVEKLQAWALGLSQGDGSVRFEIETFIGAAGLPVIDTAG